MWQLVDNQLYQKFTFKDFKEAFVFMTRVAHAAEEMQHHPRWSNQWNEVEIWLSTHENGDEVTDKDRVLAEAIDTINGERQSSDT